MQSSYFCGKSGRCLQLPICDVKMDASLYCTSLNWNLFTRTTCISSFKKTFPHLPYEVNKGDNQSERKNDSSKDQLGTNISTKYFFFKMHVIIWRILQCSPNWTEISAEIFQNLSTEKTLYGSSVDNGVTRYSIFWVTGLNIFRVDWKQIPLPTTATFVYVKCLFFIAGGHMSTAKTSSLLVLLPAGIAERQSWMSH